jgi:hypothetical protein
MHFLCQSFAEMLPLPTCWLSSSYKLSQIQIFDLFSLKQSAGNFAPSRGLAQILPFTFRRPFMRGRAQLAEQDSKMFKNIRLNQFWDGWALTFSVNLSSSETMLAGAAS